MKHTKQDLTSVISINISFDRGLSCFEVVAVYFCTKLPPGSYFLVSVN